MNSAVPVTAPLRCTAFEEFMLDQDSPAYPCVICLRLELTGHLDTPRLSQALSEVVERHPLLRAKLQCDYGKLWWHIDHAGTNALHVHQEAAPAWPVQRHFDLSQEFGWQAELFPTARRAGKRDPAESTAEHETPAWTFFLQVHHTIADGLGCLQIAEELLLAYAQPGQRSHAASAVDLRNRNRFGLNFKNLLQLIPKQFVGLAGVRQFLSRQPMPMSPRVVAETASPNITSVDYRCTAAQSQQLKQAANQRQATLNDLLAGLVFEACDQYRQMQMSYRGNEWLRMMVPMNMRDPQSTQPPVCNMVSCVFLDRTGQQISDRDELLKSIHEEMELIKSNRLAFVFIFSLWIKKVLRWRTRSRALVTTTPSRCQTSIVFSNMGRLFERTALPKTADGQLIAEGVTLHSCDVLAPIAPLMRIAFTAYYYADRITLSLRYDSNVFTAADAQRLQGLLVQRIASLTLEPVRA